MAREGTSTKKRLALWVGIPGLVLVLAVMAFAIFQPIQVLPRYRLAPGYALTDQSGQWFSSESVRGDVVLYSLGYAGCGERCEGSEATIREVRDRLEEVDLGDVDMKFVTLSLDPDDTPAALAAHAAEVGADGDVWRLAMGSENHMANVVRAGLRSWYDIDGDNGDPKFDPTLVLVDGWGVIRGEYKYQTIASDADKIIRHLDILGEELRNATGAATIAYEAAHFFLCYP